MDGTNTQINLKVEDPTKFMPPKIEISVSEPKQVSQRPHKLKPRDMNVLTPSGFWCQTSLLWFSVPHFHTFLRLLMCFPAFFCSSSNSLRLRGKGTTFMDVIVPQLPLAEDLDEMPSSKYFCFQLNGPNKKKNKLCCPWKCFYITYLMYLNASSHPFVFSGVILKYLVRHL